MVKKILLLKLHLQNTTAISKANLEFSVAILQQLNRKTLIYNKLH